MIEVIKKLIGMCQEAHDKVCNVLNSKVRCANPHCKVKMSISQAQCIVDDGGEPQYYCSDNCGLEAVRENDIYPNYYYSADTWMTVLDEVEEITGKKVLIEEIDGVYAYYYHDSDGNEVILREAYAKLRGKEILYKLYKSTDNWWEWI